MKRIQARILEDAGSFARDDVRLALLEDVGERSAFLCSDGLWRTAPGSELPSMPEDVEIGIRLPRRALEEIVQAIEEYRGAAAHGATEAKVLREALDVERGRVDAVLARVIPR